ncbi:fimbrillin family protein [uncultured Rikenella sp.]|uniref:BF2992 family fimbrillin-A clan protein n=1 Tax=uncultured Rikenella sp. TaxID=368003 RepID=UPI0026071A5B|nr:fimbrillin family protein [uncultured Rikenella sp.]
MKQYLLIAAVLLTVGGCQRHASEEFSEGLFAVRFQSGNTVEAAATKAGASGPLAAGSTVRVVAYQRGAAGQAAPDLPNDTWKASATYRVESDGSFVPCFVNDDGSDSGASGAKTMELHNGTYDFYAYSTARKLESDNRTVKGVGHGEDFMGAYVGSQTISRSANTVALPFEHECAKTTFRIEPVTAANGGLTSDSLFADSVVMHNMATSPAADYTIGSDLASTVGGTNDSGVIRTFAYLNAAQKGDGASGSGIFLPKSTGKKVPAEFYIKVNKTRYLLKADLPDMAFLKGRNYTFTARVKQGSVDLVLNIVPWNQVAQNDPNMGADNSSILIGSWGGVDWSGSMGGNTDQVTAPLQVGTWTSVALPADFLGPNGAGQVGNWGQVDPGNTDVAGPNGPGQVGNWGQVGGDNAMGGNPDKISGTPQVGSWGQVGENSDFAGSNGSGRVDTWGQVNAGTDIGK